MNASGFTITIEAKLSKSYQSFGCSITAQVIVDEGDTLERAAEEARAALHNLVHNTAVQGLRDALEAVRSDI